MAFLSGAPALSPGGVERQMRPSLFGFDPAERHFSSVLQADLHILMHKQPPPCHQLAGTFQRAPTKSTRSKTLRLSHFCLTASLTPSGLPSLKVLSDFGA